MLASNHDVNMTAEIKPLVAVGQDTMATNTGPVTMQSNPSYGVALRKDVISATNV